MRKILATALVAVGAMAAAVAPADSQDQPSPGVVPAPAEAAAPAPPPGCKAFSTRHKFRWYAKRSYHSRVVSKHERHRMRELRRCAASRADSKWMLRVQIRQARARHVRVHMLCGTPSCNRRLGYYMADRRYGPGAGACLDSFIQHESGWSMDISYGGRHGPPGNVAWGIPQALPPSKMASAGRDWATNPATQIRWLLGYVTMYGGPCGAAAHWRSARTY